MAINPYAGSGGPVASQLNRISDVIRESADRKLAEMAERNRQELALNQLNIGKAETESRGALDLALAERDTQKTLADIGFKQQGLDIDYSDMLRRDTIDKRNAATNEMNAQTRAEAESRIARAQRIENARNELVDLYGATGDPMTAGYLRDVIGIPNLKMTRQQANEFIVNNLYDNGLRNSDEQFTRYSNAEKVYRPQFEAMTNIDPYSEDGNKRLMQLKQSFERDTGGSGTVGAYMIITPGMTTEEAISMQMSGQEVPTRTIPVNLNTGMVMGKDAGLEVGNIKLDEFKQQYPDAQFQYIPEFTGAGSTMTSGQTPLKMYREYYDSGDERPWSEYRESMMGGRSAGVIPNTPVTPEVPVMPEFGDNGVDIATLRKETYQRLKDQYPGLSRLPADSGNAFLDAVINTTDGRPSPELLGQYGLLPSEPVIPRSTTEHVGRGYGAYTPAPELPATVSDVLSGVYNRVFPSEEEMTRRLGSMGLQRR